ncbi:glycosyltransferase family 4 protein [Nocardioides sp. R1-1]|uniref:glycosyltransferase family 4 protein n=1 Tax=Nocardioides sp. R1-1 TaxID=3383502 RepID=UPI0038CF2D17
MADPRGPLSVVLLHWGRTGAGPRLTYDLTRALLARGDVRVAVSDVSGTERDADIARLGAPRLAVTTYTSVWGALLGLPRLAANIMRFRRLLRTVAADVVVTPMYSLWQSVAIRLLLPRRVRLLATVHDAVPHPGDDHLAKRWARGAELGRADGVMVLSESVADALRQRGHDRAPVFVTVHAAFGGGGTAAPRPAPRHEPAVLGFFGRILPYKGLDLLLDATAVLRGRGLDVVTAVHGDGTVPPGRAGAEHVTWHLGWVSEERTNEVVAGFDVLVLPYREASQSGVLSIALAEGVPVVATPVGGLAEQVRATGCGVVADAVTAEAVADATAALLADPDQYAACSRRALAAAASDHGWDRVAADYLRAAAQVAGR